jgi:hypothetical protein
VNLQPNYKNYLALLEVLKQGDFKIKGDAVMHVAHLFKWFGEIGSHIQKLDEIKIGPIKEEDADK